ncbi:MAG: hypothetical protein WBQ73_00205 [Candidatus Babeliales bacterium]
MMKRQGIVSCGIIIHILATLLLLVTLIYVGMLSSMFHAKRVKHKQIYMITEGLTFCGIAMCKTYFEQLVQRCGPQNNAITCYFEKIPFGHLCYAKGFITINKGKDENQLTIEAHIGEEDVDHESIQCTVVKNENETQEGKHIFRVQEWKSVL